MTIPALRQSIVQKMACEYGYQLVHIDGVKFPDTEQGERGVDIHAALAPYGRHCAKKRVPADFAYLESLCKALGEEAFSVLETCRDNLVIDWQNFKGAEIFFGMDENFRPTWSYDHDGLRVPIDPVWGIEGSGNEPAYCGIIDLLYVMPGGTSARIPDWKSHFRQFPADTDQGKLYDLAVMMHLPDLREAEFSLRFVRYPNVVTSHTYYREDVPQLMDAMRRLRERQVNIHRKVEALRIDPTLATASPDEYRIRVHGGPQCTYCPCILNPDKYPCPIEPLNTQINRTPAEWVSTKMVIDTMKRIADSTLQQLADEQGPIRSQDANGKWHTYGPKPTESVSVPLFAENGQGGFDMPAVDALIEWAKNNPQDLVPTRKGSKPWFCNLRIGWSQLKSYLKANKRELVHNRIRDLATITNTVEYGITHDPELDEGKPWDAAGNEEMEF